MDEDRARRATSCRPTANNLLAHALVAFGGYFLFGGLKLFKQSRHGRRRREGGGHGGLLDRALDDARDDHLRRCSAVLFLDVNVGMARSPARWSWRSLGVADHEQAIKRMPWTVILMVAASPC